MSISSLILVALVSTFSLSSGYNDRDSLSSSSGTNWIMGNEVLNSQSPTNARNLEAENLQVVNRNNLNSDYLQSTCQLVQIVHLLNQAGCQPKAIASFACSGSCPSYVQMSTSKFWQHERSCSCCQQTGLREATFTLDCPSLDPPYKKVKTYAPVDCLCRACTDLGRENLQPQELVEAMTSDQKND